MAPVGVSAGVGFKVGTTALAHAVTAASIWPLASAQLVPKQLCRSIPMRTTNFESAGFLKLTRVSAYPCASSTFASEWIGACPFVSVLWHREQFAVRSGYRFSVNARSDVA